MGRKFLVGVALVMMVSVAVYSQTLETTGRIEGRVGLVPSSFDDSQNMLHMERVNIGLQQSFNFLSLNYQLTGGGILQGSADLDRTQFLPEYQVRAQMVPLGRMKLELFSYSQLRNPMQIARDTLTHQEQVSGLQIESPMGETGRIVAAFGTRSATRNESEIKNQFYKLQLEKQLLGLKFRVRGEKDLYTSGVTERDEDHSNLTLQWHGSPLKKLSWTGMNSLYSFGGQEHWQIYQRLNYKLSEKSTLWTHLSNQQVAYNGTYINTRAYDVDFRRKLGQHFIAQVITEGKQVNPLEGDPVYHWRSYSGGLHWRFGTENTALGLVQGGFKESYRFGSGVDIRYELEERFPVFHTRLMKLGISDYSEGEFFIRLDEEDDARYDIDHELRVNLDFLPGQKVQVGNTFKLMNHFGTDLDFSSDTLRNAFTHNIQLKYIQRKFRVSLDHLTISEMGESSDLRLHLNTRATYQLARGRSLNLLSMYRYKSDYFEKYLWLNTFVKINMKYFTWAVELQAQGKPDRVFDENLSVWLRFVRHL